MNIMTRESATQEKVDFYSRILSHADGSDPHWEYYAARTIDAARRIGALENKTMDGINDILREFNFPEIVCSCGQCEQDKPLVVIVASNADGEYDPATICPECLAEALQMVEEAKS